ncbi:uncharacterized protein DS421_19g648530 [Arachis hypogaea]|uniref:Uncharacterized protein n=1 Tax=Arachis hypogaea TaxID=3818 RepID=A0A6B9V9R0_ARAHY|nr:uncharacterized protein DS421_19g648530 [Arachis hypogaea]
MSRGEGQREMSRGRVTHLGSMEGYRNQATMEIGGLLELRMATPRGRRMATGGYGSGSAARVLLLHWR